MSDDAVLKEFAAKNHYAMAAWLLGEGGQVVFVVETVMGGGQLCIGGVTDVEGVHERYSYGTLVEAIVAFAMWSGRGWEDEPSGWIRHTPSFRRRVYDADGVMINEEVRE